MPGLSDRRLVRVVSANLTPHPHFVFVCFPLFPLFLCCFNSLIPSVVVPDLSDRRLVRVFSAAPIPCPPVSYLVRPLERSSGFSDRRLVRIVRLPPQTPDCCPLAGALIVLAFGFSDRRLVRISVACSVSSTLTQKRTLRFWLLTGQWCDLCHSLDGTTYSAASCTIMD